MRAFALAMAALCVMAPASATAESVAVNGVDLHYTVRGTGEPLVLLHGFGSCAAGWNGMAEKLSATHKVIAIDARGHGKSTNPSGKFAHAQAAEDVRALLDALGIKQTRVMGFSSGGMTALHLAIRHPDRVSKMVVIGATNYFPEGAREILQSSTMDTTPPPVLENYRQCAARGEEQVRSIVDQFRAMGFDKNEMNIQPADLAKVKAKTLIVHGDRDFFFPVSIPVGLYQAIAGSALWIVPNGDHEPTAGADEHVFISNVSAFFAK
jgi:pimeloyl-ACP methyl ester carboxylesterase